MPPYEKCQQSFILEVATQKKKHLLTTKVCGKLPPGYKELMVKNCYHDIVNQCPDILEYLPVHTTPKGVEVLPPHEFFWGVLYTLYYDASCQYIKDTEEKRSKETHQINKKTQLAIPEELIDELLKFDYVSKKKGNRRGTLLLKKKKTNLQGAQLSGGILQPPAGGDVSIWHSKLTPAQRAAYERGLASGYKSMGMDPSQLQQRDSF